MMIFTVDISKACPNKLCFQKLSLCYLLLVLMRKFLLQHSSSTTVKIYVLLKG